MKNLYINIFKNQIVVSEFYDNNTWYTFQESQQNWVDNPAYLLTSNTICWIF